MNYRQVLFQDITANKLFLTKSTIETTETMEYEGKTYPLHRIEVSSASHPFYTGKNVVIDSEGMIEKFNRRYG